MNLDKGNCEQIRRMVSYKDKVSKELGHDVGETGYFAWVEKYSDKFRKWVESKPSEEGATGFIGMDFKED